MYGHFHAWNGEEYTEDTIPMFYAEATDEMGQIVEQLSFDAIAVAQRIEEESRGGLDLSDVVPVHEWLQSSYSRVTGDVTTVATCLRTGPIQARKAPVSEVSPGRFVPDFAYRYLREDIPFGLVVTRAFAQIANVPTPMIDQVITWGQSKMQKVYLVDGRLEGPDARDLPIPQNYGISTLPDLFGWYDDNAAAGSRKSQADLAP
jgi:opine dehydrogenase